MFREREATVGAPLVPRDSEHVIARCIERESAAERRDAMCGRRTLGSSNGKRVVGCGLYGGLGPELIRSRDRGSAGYIIVGIEGMRREREE